MYNHILCIICIINMYNNKNKKGMNNKKYKLDPNWITDFVDA